MQGTVHYRPVWDESAGSGEERALESEIDVDIWMLDAME
jgi:hypothetical protein